MPPRRPAPASAPEEAAALEEIRRGEARPVYLLHGSEEFLVEAAARRLVEALAREEGVEVLRLDGDGVDWAGLAARLRTGSLFGSRIVFLVRGAGILSAAVRASAPQDAAGEELEEPAAEEIPPGEAGRGESAEGGADPAERLRVALEAGPGANVLILTAGSPDRRLALYRTIQRVGRVLDFSPSRGEVERKAARLVRERFREAGKTAAEAAVDLLFRRVGSDLRRLAAEADKLVAHAGERTEVTAADVDALIGRSREEQIFDLAEIVGRGDVPGAVTSLRLLLRQGEPYMGILGFLRNQFERILEAREILGTDLAGRWTAGMEYPSFQRDFLPALRRMQEAGEIRLRDHHPYALYKTLQVAGSFTAAGVERILRSMLDVQRSITAGAGAPPLLIEDFLHRACRLRNIAIRNQ